MPPLLARRCHCSCSRLSALSLRLCERSCTVVSGAPASNALGGAGAVIADVVVQSLGLAGWVAAIMMLVFGVASLVDIGADLIPWLDHLLDDLGADAVRLSPDVMARLEALINRNTVAGNRYNEQANREVDTEVFA